MSSDTLLVDEASSVTGRRRGSPRTVVLTYAATLFALITLNFALPRAMPGDPLAALLARSGSPVASGATRNALARYYGVDQPLPIQYLHYLGALAHGDLGVSTSDGVPVGDLIRQHLPWTLLLLGVALALAAAVGLLSGVQSGWRSGRILDRGLLSLLVGLNNVPTFFLATVAVILFAIKLRWFPIAGASTPFLDSSNPLQRIGDIAYHLILPASVLAIQSIAGIYLLMRAGMVGELGADYLLLGRAKGLRERRLKYRYAARNALLPVITLISLQVAFIVSGDIFVETVFGYPGMGGLIFDAIGSRDYPTLQACFLLLTLLVITANLVADLLYTRLDPRAAA